LPPIVLGRLPKFGSRPKKHSWTSYLQTGQKQLLIRKMFNLLKHILHSGYIETSVFGELQIAEWSMMSLGIVFNLLWLKVPCSMLLLLLGRTVAIARYSLLLKTGSACCSGALQKNL